MMPKKEVFRTTLTPSNVERESLESAHEKLAATLSNPSKVKLSIFLGGATGNYNFSLSQVKTLFRAVQNTSAGLGDYLVTTSRRTDDDICEFIKNEINTDVACQTAVIATEDSRPEVVNGMMAIADILIVSEDSISMISEAAATGKQVIVMIRSTIPGRHQRDGTHVLDTWADAEVRIINLSYGLEQLIQYAKENDAHLIVNISVERAMNPMLWFCCRRENPNHLFLPHRSQRHSPLP